MNWDSVLHSLFLSEIFSETYFNVLLGSNTRVYYHPAVIFLWKNVVAEQKPTPPPSMQYVTGTQEQLLVQITVQCIQIALGFLA